MPAIEETWITALNKLQNRLPLALEGSQDVYALFVRKAKMEASIQNQFHLMALLDEQSNQPQLHHLFRADTDYLRLLEMSENLALSYTPIKQPDASNHFLLDLLLRKVAHDGVYLAKMLGSSHPQFSQSNQQPFMMQ